MQEEKEELVVFKQNLEINDDAKNAFEQKRFIFSPYFFMDIKEVKECQDSRNIPPK